MDFLHRTWVEIDMNALTHNFNIAKKYSNGTPIMAVVKANAYGHSVKDVAPLLQELGADSFAVSNLEEALQLRNYGITKPVLILGYTPASFAGTLAEHDITQAVFSYDFAEKLSAAAEECGVTVKVHIKLDTGMGRIGFDCRSDALNGIDEAICAANLKNFDCEGVFTHFAVADTFDHDGKNFTDAQYHRFLKAIETMEKAGLHPLYRHCCNSAGSCLQQDKHLDYCRPGIILYGLTPSVELELGKEFTPVMTFKSVVSMVKTIKSGETVSYGRTFTADRDMRVASVSAGYADGYPRKLSNLAEVVVRGKRAKIIGRVCMDQFMIDASDIPDISADDEVILFGKELPVEELAVLSDTINYEIVCGISPRVPRIIKK